MLPTNFVEYIYHVDCAHDLHSIIQSGLIAAGKVAKKRTTDGILHSRGPYARASGRTRLRREQTTYCNLQAQMESASKRSLLGQLASSTKEGIDILPDAVSCNHPP